MQNLTETIQNLILNYGLNVVWAIIILIVGRWAAGFLSNLVTKALSKTDTNATLIRFVSTLVYYAALVFTVVAAFDRVGIETTSLVAVLGAAGLAVGLALQGALGNFAAGVLILFFRPFKVGDLVEITGVFGRVEDIQIFTTIILTPDNKTVIIPNGQVTSGNITNYSTKGIVRLDIVYGVGYGDDLLQAKQVIQGILDNHKDVVADPAPTVSVHSLGDSSVNLIAQPFVDPDDYWPITFDITEKVKLALDEAGISIPFPQRDVHLFAEK